MAEENIVTYFDREHMWDKSGNGAFNHDIAFTRQYDTIAVTEGNGGKVWLMNSLDGSTTEDTRSQNILNDPWGIAFHPAENVLYVCDYWLGCVMILNPITLDVRRKLKFDSIKFPRGIAILSDGKIAVTDAVLGSGKVGIFESDGTQCHLVTTYNDVNFISPWCLAADKEDNLYVTDGENNKIIKLNKTGQYVCEWSTGGNPRGLAIKGNIILTAEAGSQDAVMAYDLDGKNGRKVLDWEAGENENFGCIRSLAIHRDLLVVLGTIGMKLYRLNAR